MGAAGEPGRACDEFLEQCRRMLAEEAALPLRRKLVAHRGWHSVGGETAGRPLENTRQAYLDAARLGVAFAECDVWSTSDGEIVLSHDFCMECMAEDPRDPIATRAIAYTPWAELQRLRLKGGAAPVLLSTALRDLAGTGTRLIVELKSRGPAAPLAAMLGAHSDLKASVAFVMSFALQSVEAFTEALAEKDVRVLWLLDNPSVPYAEEDLADGETTFDYARETLTMCLCRLGVRERVRRLGCGLYVQYNPCLTQAHVYAWRMELAAILGAKAGEQTWDKDSDYAIGIWSDACSDPGFDRAASFSSWLAAASCFNSDFPPAFWEGFS